MEIPSKVKEAVKTKLLGALEQYFAEAEEHEDDDVLQNLNAEKRFNDFVIWFHEDSYKGP